jgi:hypothetical protein
MLNPLRDHGSVAFALDQVECRDEPRVVSGLVVQRQTPQQSECRALDVLLWTGRPWLQPGSTRRVRGRGG